MLTLSRDTHGLSEGHLPDVNLKIFARLLPMIVWLFIEMSICTRKREKKTQQNSEQMDLGR